MDEDEAAKKPEDLNSTEQSSEESSAPAEPATSEDLNSPSLGEAYDDVFSEGTEAVSEEAVESGHAEPQEASAVEDSYEDEYAYEYDYDGLDDAVAEARERGMSFIEHLEEFRWTVARSLIAFVIGVVVVLVFNRDIAELMQMPLHKAYGSAEVAKDNLITYKAMGVISVFFQIALLGGLTLSMPFVLYFLGSFVAPGLTDQEKKILKPSCFAAFALFITGVCFAFFIILPLTLTFTVRLNNYYDFDIFWAASDYYNMVVWFSLSVGAFFQFPLIVVILVYLGVLTTEKLKSIRRGVFVGIMVLAAFLSPGGDFISLPLTTGFMYALYECAIWLGGRLEAKKRAEALAREGEA